MLSGSLEAFGLEEVLRFIAASGVTGRIDVVRSRAAGMLLFDEGELVGASRTEVPVVTEDAALEVVADLFEGSGGAFVLSRLSDAPIRVIDLPYDRVLASVRERLRTREAASTLRELAEPHARIELDKPAIRVLTREEQRMRLRL